MPCLFISRDIIEVVIGGRYYLYERNYKRREK